MAKWAALMVVCVLAAGDARAQPELDDERAEPAYLDEGFGPRIVIDDIVVVGNGSTATRLILRALPFSKGESLAAGDPRLAKARYKVLALGFFLDAKLSLGKGGERGHVIVTVEVIERGTLALNRFYLGATELTPWWAGIDVTERNFLGTGTGIGGGFVVAGNSELDGAETQWAAQLRFSDPSILGTPVGAFLSLAHVDASEPYRVSGARNDGDPELFSALGYTRTGGKAGASYDLTPLQGLTAGARVEVVRADVPTDPTWTDEAGTTRAVDLGLVDGTSRVINLALSWERDTRANPVLPFNGSRAAVLAEVGGAWTGSSYDYGTVFAQYSKWWSVAGPGHVLSVHATGAAVFGDAPVFDRLFVGDLNRFLTPRELGLVLSTRESYDLLGNRADDQRYGEYGGQLGGEYAIQLFRGGRHIYGGDLYFGVGLWALERADNRMTSGLDGLSKLPVGLTVNTGLRFDTELGIVELSVANGLGRTPL